MFPIEQADLFRIRACFSEMILNRGWGYYQGDAVSSLEVEGHRAQAIVFGTKSYRVQLDLKNFPASTCTCPYDDFCKHMAAVLFETLARTGPEQLALIAPKQQLALVPKRDARHAAAFRASTSQPQETDSIEEWHKKLDRILEKVDHRGSIPLEIFLHIGRIELLPYAEHWTPDIRALYDVHVGMHLLVKLDAMYQQPYHLDHHRRFYARSMIARWINDLHVGLSNLQITHPSKGYLECLEETIRHLSYVAFPQQETVTDWTQFYRMFWGVVPVSDHLIQQEILRLRTEKEQAGLSLHLNKRLLNALIHLFILTGQDKQAMEVADRELPLLEKDDFFDYMDAFVAEKKWSRLIEWVRWLKPTSRILPRTLIDRYIECWRFLEREGYAADGEREEVLAELLPDSLYDYLLLLLMQNRYREWVDLHLWFQSDPLELEKGELNLVADRDLPSLLPLYHQAAERWILVKNREAYKQSIKILKKLKTHYRKLKQLPRWEQFIEQLSIKYKRLSAFQEELRKGKLLP